MRGAGESFTIVKFPPCKFMIKSKSSFSRSVVGGGTLCC